MIYYMFTSKHLFDEAVIRPTRTTPPYMKEDHNGALCELKYYIVEAGV
jgi:hypothetical protein